MLEHLPLIVFLVTFVLIFVLRMPIPAGMIAACTLYFLTCLLYTSDAADD